MSETIHPGIAMLRERKEVAMNNLELRYHAIQCHVRSQRAVNPDDRTWLISLSTKLSAMADVNDEQQLFRASKIIFPDQSAS
jgi:hypothetical protein